jgi:hypothetical protein
MNYFFHSDKWSALQYIFDTMLSEIVKQKLETKAGIRVRYTRDCRALANKISEKCNCVISASTIQRLFGLTKGTKEPRAYTLDIISNYLGYKDWDNLLDSYSNASPKTERIINELRPSKLKTGERFLLSYKPDTTISIEYAGKNKFKVLAARNSRLNQGDIFKVSVIALHHPLFILDVEGTEHGEGRLVEGKISGITSIKKI